MSITTPRISASVVPAQNPIPLPYTSPSLADMTHEEVNLQLRHACHYGNLNRYQRLMTLGADVNGTDEETLGTTALYCAAKGGFLPIVKALVEAGAHVDKPFAKSLDTPLIEASKGGHYSVVETLIAAGANLNLQNIWGGTALMLATRQGHWPIIGALLGVGARTDIIAHDGRTALSYAIMYEHPDIINLLVRLWPATMIIVVLQELYVYNSMDLFSFKDLYDFLGNEFLNHEEDPL